MMILTILLCVVLFYVCAVIAGGFWLQPNYIKRWHLIPRNRWRNIYLHHIVGPDGEENPHDHPWDFKSIILKGYYRERRYAFLYCPKFSKDHATCAPDWMNHTLYDVWSCEEETHHEGTTHDYKACDAHNIIDVHWNGAWTLVITKETTNEWGFFVPTYFSDMYVDKIKAGHYTEERPGPDLWRKHKACDYFKHFNGRFNRRNK